MYILYIHYAFEDTRLTARSSSLTGRLA